MAGAADQPSLELVKTIPLKGRVGKLDHLALDAKNDRLFVANKPNNTLDIVDLKAGKLVRQIGGKRLAAPPVGATNQADLSLQRACERYRALIEVIQQLRVEHALGLLLTALFAW